MAIVHEIKAKGPLTTILLSIVALDDAAAILFFSIALGIAQPLASGGTISLYQTLMVPFMEIAFSIGIGAVIGLALIYLAKMVHIRALLLVAVVGAILLGVGITEVLGLSVIMCNMVIGFVVANLAQRGEMFIIIDEIEDAVFVLFFVLAGLHFDLDVIRTTGIVALVITIGRFCGKYLGTTAGAAIAKSPSVIRKYLGPALLPQAGVAIGLALLAEEALPQFGSIILNATLAAVIINELIAPPLVKKAIISAKEAGLK
jgi:Kef-type K+ transport system membrane component KefB